MLRGSLAILILLVTLAGCPGGDGALGDTCRGNGDCDGTLQCLNSRCVARCGRAPDCGDGYSCDERGLCQLATDDVGEPCSSEVDCAPGLACQIDGAAVDGNSHLLASCTAQYSARPAGSDCSADSDCRNGTCALGRCVDLCRETRDCGAGTACVDIPRVAAGGALFAGCLPSEGTLTWSIPVTTPSAEVLLPVPSIARSVELVMSIDDPTQKVGAKSVLSPMGARIYTVPCSPLSPTEPCSPTAALDQYFGSQDATLEGRNKLRHLPATNQSVLLIPSGSAVPIETGDYVVRVSSFRPNGTDGSAVPRVTAVIQLSTGVTLDLHFFFLDLSDHPCIALDNNAQLTASSAASSAVFQGYLDQLHALFARAGLALGPPTFEDIVDRPELDGLDVANAGALLALGKYATGINVFFVRSLAPIGLQAFGPNPGPAGLAGTPESGIVIGVDTLCYRDWTALARLTAYESARYMGLYHNVELDTALHPTWRDPISDSPDTSDNLMYFSERGGSEITAGQSAVLSQSAVLR
jgi:hypothetical protein